MSLFRDTHAAVGGAAEFRAETMREITVMRRALRVRGAWPRGTR